MAKLLTSRAQLRATRILNLKIVRRYLIENPGSTCAQVFSALKLGGLLDLQCKGLAYWKREDGMVKWYARSGLAYPNAGKHE